MLTRLGFKFFILLFTFLLAVTAAQAEFPFWTSQGDTIPFIPETGPYQADTIPLRPETVPGLADTIPFDPYTEFYDGFPQAPARQTGSANILDTRVDYSAVDSIFFDIKRHMVFLYGDADLTYGNINLKADYIEIDFRSNELFAKGMPDSLGIIRGNPVFTEADQSFESEELRYNFETKRGRTVNVITQEADGYVHGHFVKIQPDKVIHVQQGKYTTCDDPDPHFHIGFRKAKLIPDDKIITSVAFLVIEGVTLPLFLPFGFFPSKKTRASGILMPTYGESANRGFYLENGGYYLGINDYVDLSLRGDIYSRGSWGLRLGSNYRARYKYSGSLNLNYAINVMGERDLPTYQRSRDFRINWSHSQDPKARPNSTFRANVNAGSANSTRFNPDTERDYLSNTFSSNISYSASLGGKVNFSASARHSQNTINRMMDLSLPEMVMSVNRIHPFRRKQSAGRSRWYEEISLSYSVNARNEIRTPDTLLFDSQIWSRMRNGVSHSIPISHSARVLRHFNLSTSVNYNERWYFNTIEKSWDENIPFMNVIGGDTIYGRERIDTIPGFRAARDFSFSSGLSTRLYGMRNFRRGPVTAIRHVVSPSMSFSFRPDFGDPFWGYYQSYYSPARQQDVIYSIFEGGLYGTPAANRSGNLGFNITNNLEMKVRDRKEEDAADRKIALIDNFTISGGYDMARDSLNWSDFRLSGRTRLFGQFDVTYSSSYTVYARDVQGRYMNRYLWDDQNKIFQLNNTSWSLSFNYNLSSRNRGSGRSLSDRPGAGAFPEEDPSEGMPLNGISPGNDLADEPGIPEIADAVDYSVPWSLNFSYSFNYNSRFRHADRNFDRSYIQNLSVSGNIGLTPNWRIGFRTGFDFDRKEITYTSVDIYRDLHCWEMSVNWIPFGFRKSYNFTLRVKSSVLQDLKFTKRTHHLDRGIMR